ncbi:uncharacterized protein LOC142351484 [Convolutriloba macropyga]|uniref:uncharacterized protein LOC142351484 n=1 Tax=Convolutriloba macropyga TaxID=536237 RepID=UPI003F5275D2
MYFKSKIISLLILSSYFLQLSKCHQEEQLDYESGNIRHFVNEIIRVQNANNDLAETETIYENLSDLYPLEAEPGFADEWVDESWGSNDGELMKRPSGFMKRPSEFLKRPSEFLKRPSTFIKRPSGFIKRSPELSKRPSEFLKRPSELLKRPSEFLKRPSEFLKRPSGFMRRSTFLEPMDVKRSPASFLKRAPGKYL